FGPYVVWRWEISAASSPFAVLVFNRRTASSAATACQVAASLPAEGIAAVFMRSPPTQCGRERRGGLGLPPAHQSLDESSGGASGRQHTVTAGEPVCRAAGPIARPGGRSSGRRPVPERTLRLRA